MTDDQPLISIALCTYNGETFLSEQLDSILNQDYKNFELIISDDCSTDNTSIILEDYNSRDQRIEILKSDYNQGYILNFEKAIKHCKGEILFLSDQDDIWVKSKLTEISNCFVNNIDLVFHDSLFIDEKGKSLQRKMSDRFTLDQKINPLSFILFNAISGHALAFRKKLLENILPLPKGVHHDCWISFVASCNKKLMYYNKPLVNYRQHNTSETDLLKLKKQKGKDSAAIRDSRLIERTNKFLEIENNPQRDKYNKFKNLLLRRKNQYISLNLFLFMSFDCQNIFRFKRKKGLIRMFYAFPYLWGIKLKK